MTAKYTSTKGVLG